MYIQLVFAYVPPKLLRNQPERVRCGLVRRRNDESSALSLDNKGWWHKVGREQCVCRRRLLLHGVAAERKVMIWLTRYASRAARCRLADAVLKEPNNPNQRRIVFHSCAAALFFRARHDSDHWFQLRIWRQARASGLYAAQCMADSVDELGSRGAFDLFVHATQFFGYQVRPSKTGPRNLVLAADAVCEMDAWT